MDKGFLPEIRFRSSLEKNELVNFDSIKGSFQEPVEQADLGLAERVLGGLPAEYILLLRASNGVLAENGVTLYSALDLIERNQTYEISTYAPDYLAVGDDGGGKAVLLLRTSPGLSPIYLIGHGAIGSYEPTILSESLEAWIESGLEVGISDDDEIPEYADVYLESVPHADMRVLVEMKRVLGLQIGIGELKTLATRVPVCIAQGVPYGKYRKRCETLNDKYGDFLILR